MATMKSTFEKFLRRKMNAPQDMNEALTDGGGRITVREGIVASILGKALAGDLQAASFVRDICGEKAAAAARSKKEDAPQDMAVVVRVVESDGN